MRPIGMAPVTEFQLTAAPALSKQVPKATRERCRASIKVCGPRTPLVRRFLALPGFSIS
jgi:hypothetical protein